MKEASPNPSKRGESEKYSDKNNNLSGKKQVAKSQKQNIKQ
jgi:hypothetical protein